MPVPQEARGGCGHVCHDPILNCQINKKVQRVISECKVSLCTVSAGTSPAQGTSCTPCRALGCQPPSSLLRACESCTFSHSTCTTSCGASRVLAGCCLASGFSLPLECDDCSVWGVCHARRLLPLPRLPVAVAFAKGPHGSLRANSRRPEGQGKGPSRAARAPRAAPQCLPAISLDLKVSGVKVLLVFEVLSEPLGAPALGSRLACSSLGGCASG